MNRREQPVKDQEIDPLDGLVKAINYECEYHVQDEILKEALWNESMS
jgi:hypothetical protein